MVATCCEIGRTRSRFPYRLLESVRMNSDDTTTIKTQYLFSWSWQEPTHGRQLGCVRFLGVVRICIRIHTL